MAKHGSPGQLALFEASKTSGRRRYRPTLTTIRQRSRGIRMRSRPARSGATRPQALRGRSLGLRDAAAAGGQPCTSSGRVTSAGDTARPFIKGHGDSRQKGGDARLPDGENRAVGVDDRDWMRSRSIFGWTRPEYARETRQNLRGTPRRVNRAMGHRAERVWAAAAVGLAVGIAIPPTWARVDARYIHPGPEPPALVNAHVRMWVPAAKHGHVKVVRVRVLVPRR
jgi:hypothetical protein